MNTNPRSPRIGAIPAPAFIRLSTAALLLALCPLCGLAADVKFNVPATAEAERATPLLSGAAHALNDYMTACVIGRGRDAMSALTDDGAVEYALAIPGMYLSVDAPATAASCDRQAQRKHSVQRVTSLWVFPTGRPDTVFVRFNLSSDGPPRKASMAHLALIRMRDQQIVTLRFLTPALDQIAVIRRQAVPASAAATEP
jgi:hypothetical protein